MSIAEGTLVRVWFTPKTSIRGRVSGYSADMQAYAVDVFASDTELLRRNGHSYSTIIAQKEKVKLL